MSICKLVNQPSNNTSTRMHVTVKSITRRVWHFDGLDPSMSVVALKARIRDQEGIPVDQQVLCAGVHGEKLLRDDLLLADYNIRSGSILHLRVRVTDRIPAGRLLFSV